MVGIPTLPEQAFAQVCSTSVTKEYHREPKNYGRTSNRRVPLLARNSALVNR
jgi:hypothetical protein